VEDFPFGEDPLVVKVGSKLFALINSDTPAHQPKCDPVRATDLRGHTLASTPATI
jgi:predicted DNA-binding protein (MmcQ/YjbR family)